MNWIYRFDDRALKDFKKLDRQAQKNILAYFDKRIAGPHDPRRFGKALTGDLSGLWRYRVGDYRILCSIRNHELVVLIVTVSHRRNVYL
ncbi:MAG: type II toxin-antitoxin system RelE/ParE family toxin [Methylacidiphilales bacterium]|nr:type II toxin-antitoxin system RelE/ParE family toxin [Candidatus Methylacidiphilales bacterium]